MDTAGSIDENNEEFEKMKKFVKNTFYEDEQEITGKFHTGFHGPYFQKLILEMADQDLVVDYKLERLINLMRMSKRTLVFTQSKLTDAKHYGTQCGIRYSCRGVFI